MSYVDGFVLSVPTKNLPAYIRMSKKYGKIWREHGALDYQEFAGEDLDVKCGLPFPKLLKLKPDETAIFAWIVYKSRAHRDQVNAKVMRDPRLGEPSLKDLPFDMKKIANGGFKNIVSL